MTVALMVGTERDECPCQVNSFGNRSISVPRKEGKSFSLTLKGDVIYEPIPAEFNFSTSILS